MPVRSKTHNELKDQYNKLEERIAEQHANFEAIIANVQKTKNENVSLFLFIQDCLAWIEDAPLYVRGTKTPDLRKRREDLRETARKLEILVVETPAEEQSA